MRFKLKISVTGDTMPVIPINYQYPISAIIYKILAGADQTYANFLHNKGYAYQNNLKAFKLFTFSELKTPFSIKGDRLIFRSCEAELIVAFQLPKAVETFITGLFHHQGIEIGDRKSRASFTITQVTAIPDNLVMSEDNATFLFHPIGPLICGMKNDRGYYDFLSPEHPEFTRLLCYNWEEKYKAVYGDEGLQEAFNNATMEVLLYEKPPKSRLITIKEGSSEETKIRGFTNFKLKITGNEKALTLLLNAGCGIYNALGMGCIELIH